jgi:ribose transport system permease protein
MTSANLLGKIADPPEPAGDRHQPSLTDRAVNYARQAGILIPFLALFILLSFSSSSFLTTANLLNLFDQQSTILIVAVTSTLVLIAGGVDLSAGAVYALSGLVAAKLTSSGWDPYLSVAVAVVFGLVIGIVNGLFVTVIHINPLITTLATAYVVSGIATIVAGGTVLIVDDERFMQLGNAAFGQLKVTSILALLVIAATWILLSAATYGRWLFAVGGNEEAARLSGIRVTMVKVAAYAISGAGAAFAGVLVVSRVGSGQADQGAQNSLVFIVLAGIVIGGTSLLGGEGAIWKTCIGIMFLALITNGFVLLSLDSVYQQIAAGALIIIAVGADSWRRLRRR